MNPVNMRQARKRYRKTVKDAPFRAWARGWYRGIEVTGKLARIVVNGGTF